MEIVDTKYPLLSIRCFSRGIPFDLDYNTNFKGISMGKILGRAVFLKEYVKSIWNFSDISEVKEASIAFRTRERKIQSIRVYKFRYSGNGISTKHHTEIWAIHSEIAPDHNGENGKT
jgi:hypothetical protein